MAALVVPQTQYARSGDTNIAYQVAGDGPIDITIVPGSGINVPLMLNAVSGICVPPDGKVKLDAPAVFHVVPGTPLWVPLDCSHPGSPLPAAAARFVKSVEAVNKLVLPR